MMNRRLPFLGSSGTLYNTTRRPHGDARAGFTVRDVRRSTPVYLYYFLAALVGGVVLLVQLSHHPHPQQQQHTSIAADPNSVHQIEQRLKQPRRTASTTTKDRRRDSNRHIGNRMQQFPSLQEPLHDFALVGLYFAAAWCPMSTPITELLDDVFRDVLQDPRNKDFALVYVSSDRTAQAFRDYLQPGWKTIPFESMDERSAVKVMFRTCAKPEMKGLGLATRDAEIPHLVVLTADGEVLQSSKGITDVKERQTGAVGYWLSLLESQQKSAAVLAE